MKWYVVFLALILGPFLCSQSVYAQTGTDEPAGASKDASRFEVPDGFAVEKIYGSGQSGSVINITFDSQGRLVFSRERGGAVRLIEQTSGGYEEEVVTDEVTANQGMYFVGDDLLIVGNGPGEEAGLYQVFDENQDGKGDRVVALTRTTSSMRGHGPHALRLGPDGFIYWVLGNFTGIVPTPAPLSPHRDYGEDVLLPSYTDPRGHADSVRAPGGTILRKDIREPASDWEMVAGGFRNQYDADFNLLGELFTFDSDMEWDIDLPWYRPVRSVHVVPGGEYGWRTGSRKWPSYFPDNLPGMTQVGRGSPTGVTFYQHYVYPESYQGAFFQADWSRGRILAGFHTQDGATYTEELEDFVTGKPLNVTDVAVGPDGYLYFSMGGWDTEGGIYRVVYEGSPLSPDVSGAPVEQALVQPHPRSSWGQARIEELREEVGEVQWRDALMAVVSDEAAEPIRRVRALEMLHVNGPGLAEAQLETLADDPSWMVRAGAAYYLGMHETQAAREVLTRLFHDGKPMVRRRAGEALVRTGIHSALDVPLSPTDDLLPLLGSQDRWVRYSAREALERINRNRWREAALSLDTYPEAIEGLLALVHTADGTNDIPVLLEREAELLRQNPIGRDLAGLLRVIQLTIIEAGDHWYSHLYEDIGEQLLPRFPHSREYVNRELARTLGYLETPGIVDRLVSALEDPAADRQEQIFYAYVLRTVETGWEEVHQDAMVDWFKKTQDESWKGGASFRGYIRRMWDDFVARLPPEKQEEAKERVPSLTPGGEGDEMDFRRESYAEAVSTDELEEYLVSDPMSYKGNPADGREAYEKAFCATCHSYGGIGGGIGPDLTTIGRRFSREDLVEAILYPSRSISDRWTSVEIITNDNRTLAGTVVDEDAQTITMEMPTGAQTTIQKSDIASRSRADTSLMPEGLMHNLTRQEMIDLMLFLEQGVDEGEATKTSR